MAAMLANKKNMGLSCSRAPQHDKQSQGLTDQFVFLFTTSTFHRINDSDDGEMLGF